MPVVLAPSALDPCHPESRPPMYPPVPFPIPFHALDLFLSYFAPMLFRVSATDTACILGLVHKGPCPDVSLDLELGSAFLVVPRISIPRLRIAFLELGPTFVVFPSKPSSSVWDLADITKASAAR